MEKIILKGTRATQWDLGNGFRDGGVPLELTDAEIKKAKASNLIENIISDKPIEIEIPKIESKKYTKVELETMTFTELKEIGNEVGVKGRGKIEIIKDILGAQK